MDDGDDREYSRQPRPEDLAKVCAALNREGARYILIGGFAVIARGLQRPTKDIDLLIDASPDNIDRIKRALAVLPDNAARDLRNDEIEHYDVIRVADEIVIDLMSKACGVTWEEAESDSEILELDESRSRSRESRHSSKRSGRFGLTMRRIASFSSGCVESSLRRRRPWWKSASSKRRKTRRFTARHRIQSGVQTLRIVVQREPSRAGVHPHRKLIETERDDNIVDVEGSTTAGRTSR